MPQLSLASKIAKRHTILKMDFPRTGYIRQRFVSGVDVVNLTFISLIRMKFD